MKEKPTTPLEVRSDPLTNKYNSTSVIVILVFAAILALLLLLWPSG